MNKILMVFLGIVTIFMLGCTGITPDQPNHTTSPSNPAIAPQGEPQMLPPPSNFVLDDFDTIQTLEDGTKYIIHPSEILSGGPPKDGIPSIDNPLFNSVQEANEWLNDDDLILGLNHNGVVKAYPHRILNWHEIVNDKVGKDLVLITYCPLCRTGIAFNPVVNGKQVEFGTSGKLFNSELVMYDRLTDSYWPQTLGKAVIGPATGQVLEKIPLDTVEWGNWKKTHPDTLVLSKKTGKLRNYDSSPYEYFQTSDEVGFGLTFTDTRLKPKVIVYGIALNDKAKAYSEDVVNSVKLINDELGSTKIIVVWDNDLETVKMFKTNDLTFSLKDQSIIDNKNNVWTVNDMKDKLEEIPTFGHFWFSWTSFYPDTELYVLK